MNKVSSYRRQKRRTEFYRQRGEDLEAIIFDLCKQIKREGIDPKIIFRGGIIGDRILNDVNTGEFALRLYSRIR